MFLQSSEAVHPWSPFHATLSIVSDVIQDVSTVAFNPIIMAPLGDNNTLFIFMKHTKESMEVLGQNDTPIIFDMGLLTKALDTVWANPEDLSGVIPCGGGCTSSCQCLLG